MRIKFSVPRHARKKKLLRAASGSYVDRRDKKHNYRQLWITRINAAVREEGMSYSKFICGIMKAGITLNRKMLSEMAIKDPVSFKQLVDVAKKANA